MHDIKKIIDFSVWTGNWPFYHLRYARPDVLMNKLKSINVEKAFIAPIEGILEQDPLRANKDLLKKINDDFFSPVVIVDLSYENWEESVELALNDDRVKMIKLLPNYHMYEFDESTAEPLIKKIESSKLIVSVQMRVEDKRGAYPLMKVPDMDIIQVVKTISYFPEQKFIINNCFRGEIQEVVYSLKNAYVDISSIEFHNVFKHLRETSRIDRILFSSHCPFYFPEGNLFKLKYADTSLEDVEKTAYMNGEELLKNT